MGHELYSLIKTHSFCSVLRICVSNWKAANIAAKLPFSIHSLPNDYVNYLMHNLMRWYVAVCRRCVFQYSLWIEFGFFVRCSSPSLLFLTDSIVSFNRYTLIFSNFQSTREALNAHSSHQKATFQCWQHSIWAIDVNKMCAENWEKKRACENEKDRRKKETIEHMKWTNYI